MAKCHRKCYRGYKQAFILLMIHAEMVENNSFQSKMSNFGHFVWKMPQVEVQINHV